MGHDGPKKTEGKKCFFAPPLRRRSRLLEQLANDAVSYYLMLYFDWRNSTKNEGDWAAPLAKMIKQENNAEGP